MKYDQERALLYVVSRDVQSMEKRVRGPDIHNDIDYKEVRPSITSMELDILIAMKGVSDILILEVWDHGV